MVIKGKNKKRKLSENVEVEEDVPVKVVKNVNDVTDEMEVDEMYERNVPADNDEGTHDNQESQQDPEDGEERDINFKRSFNIKYFREQLREKNSIIGES